MPALLLGLWALVAPAAGADPRVERIAAVALDHRPDLLVGLELPASSRDGAPADHVELGGPWRLVSTVDGVRTWEAPLPVRPRTLFFHRPPDGMVVWRRDPGQAWEQAERPAHRRGLDEADRAGSWEFTSHALRVRRKAAEGPPAPGEYAVAYPEAVARERALQRDQHEGSDRDFTFRSAQLDDTTRTGLLLPAPASARFRLALPAGAVLDMRPGILPPEAAPPGTHSDGATLIVQVDGQLAWTGPLAVGRFDPVRVDLSAWGGREVEVQLAVEPGATSALDYAFVATPAIHAPMADPPRVAVLFVDTLRQDALSMYGYERATSPRLDAWAADAAVFEDARSVAPWTLPSSRTLFTGAQPERWEAVETLQERAATAGWATAFMAGNVYLSSNFGMERGWGTHRCVNWPLAEVQVDRALEWLDEQHDRPALLVLHLMDMHLPYTEPQAYRHLYAGEHPAELGGEDFLRADVTRGVARLGETGKQYVRDRYDNNLRYVDDQLARVLDVLDQADTVVLVSDHGEEFWDHGGFEHGHTLYDELLHVPLVVRGPGLAPGRVAVPVSLLDLAPTLARIMDLDPAGMTGRPLQGAADGSDPAFAERPIGFGRPLYGLRQWGVVAEGWKYTAADGAEQLFHLEQDPGEGRDLARRSRQPVAGLREALGRGVERPVVTALRLEPSRSSDSQDLSVRVHAPGGIAQAWAAEDPLNQARIEVEQASPTEVVLTWKGGARGVREAYVLPEGDLDAVLPTLAVQLQSGDAVVQADAQWPGDAPPPVDGKARVLLRGRLAGRTIAVDRAVVPRPDTTATALSGVDSELQRDLEALGYVDE